MRGNRSASMGLLRRQSRDHSEVVLHLPASKTSAGAERWKNIPVARSRVADTYCLSLEDVLHTPR